MADVTAITATTTNTSIMVMPRRDRVVRCAIGCAGAYASPARNGFGIMLEER